jgi:hypothetical protein
MTQSTPLRLAALTTMNTSPAIGNNALSDVGGTDGSGSADQIFTEFINNQTPTPPGEEVLDRSACPTINAVRVGDTSISGTTTEAIGTTIKVSVYDSDSTTLVGTKEVVTTGSSWTVSLTTLPSITLLENYVIKATATAPEKGESADNCSLKKVAPAVCVATAPTAYGTDANKDNFTITHTLALSVSQITITIYNVDFTVWGTRVINASRTSGTQYTDAVAGSILTNPNKVPNGTYYATVTYGGCESPRFEFCYGTSTNVNIPIINSTLSTGATVVSGTVSGTGALVGDVIIVYVDGVRVANTTLQSDLSWSVTLPTPLTNCQVVTARTSRKPVDGSDVGNCLSAASTAVTVTRTAVAPVINPSSCVGSTFTVSGSSQEADGAQVRLYTTTDGTTPLATVGTVSVTNGYWEVTGLSSITYPTNTKFIARVITGGCLTESSNSNMLTITTRTDISSYTISINNPQEGSSTVTGTISGGSYNVTIRTYVDEVLVGTPQLVGSAGAWTVSGFEPTDLYLGAQIKVTVAAGAGCESTLSTTFATVQCSPPPIPTYTEGSYSYCDGGTGQISLTNTQTGVIYQLVNSSFETVGPAVVGNGGSVTLTTNILNSNLTGVLVYAYKILNPSCGQYSTGAINFDEENPTPSVTFSSTALTVQSGTGTVNLNYTDKSTSITSPSLSSADKYTILWSFAAKEQDFEDVTTPTALSAAPGSIVITVPTTPAPAPGTYSGTLVVTSDAGGCVAYFGFTVSVFGATSPPVMTTNPAGVTICSGNFTTLTASAAGTPTLNYQWQVATSFLGTYTDVTDGTGGDTPEYETPALTATRYYRLKVTNTYGTTISDVAVVNVTSPPATPGAISGATSIRMGRSNYLLYSIAPVMGATSYTWEYVDGSGNALPGVSIIGSGTSVYVSYSSNAVSGNLRVRSEGVSNCGSSGWQTLAISITYNSCIISNKNVTPLIFR